MQKNFLDFNMQLQRNTQWCWAAVAASISKYYYRKSTWTQCRIVCNGLRNSRCCDSITVPACNRPYALHEALALTGNLYRHLPRNCNYELAIEEIDNNNVIGVRIGWSNGTGHFIAICGYSKLSGQNYYLVEDPRPGSMKKALITENRLIHNYLSTGRWTDTYLTRNGDETMVRFTYTDQRTLERANEITGVMFPKRRSRFFRNLPKQDRYQFSHSVFNISFDTLKSKDHKLTETGFRLIDMEKLVIIDLDSNSDKAEIREIIFDEQYVLQYYKSLNILLERGFFENDIFEMAFVIQAELNNFAFCLIDIEKEQKNIFLRFGPDRDNVFYTENEYFAILEEQAINSEPYDDQFGG